MSLLRSASTRSALTSVRSASASASTPSAAVGTPSSCRRCPPSRLRLDLALTSCAALSRALCLAAAASSGLTTAAPAARPPAALAVSLNATDDETRDWLMPVNRKHGLEELMATLAELYPREEGSGPGTKKKKRARDSVLLEYVLLRGVNDSEADADRFADLLARHAVCAKVNLIQFNENPGAPGLLATSADAVRAFQAMLGERGVVATVRVSRGDDESAACGMLGQLEQRRREEANAEEARAQAASSGAGEGAHVEGSGGTGYAWPAPPRLEPPARLADAVRGWDAV
mmetsp:Transcript_1107/g.4434  ORF Transcript_1107/g.4434 Transcript_1107/m.4434 type:complete len:288 (+) Transcript_1107:1568-2431(+)